MKPNAINLAKLLTYSGTLPLVACAASIDVPLEGFESVLVAGTYGAIIISFLCGIHWAAYLFFAEKCPWNFLITSNIVALLAWLSLLATHQPWPTLLQILCFIYLLAVDYKLSIASILPMWFYTLRRNATVIVVLSLCLMMRHA